MFQSWGLRNLMCIEDCTLNIEISRIPGTRILVVLTELRLLLLEIALGETGQIF